MTEIVSEIIPKVGNWWLPGKYEQQQTGQWAFDPINGARLEVSLQNPPENAPFRNNRYELILGIVEGAAVTLADCSLVGESFNLTREAFTWTRTFQAVTAFRGHHFRNKNELIFSHLTLSYSCLDSWMDANTFEVRSNYPEQAYDISYTPFESVIAKVDGATIELSAYSNSFPNPGYTNEISLRASTKMRVTPTYSIPYETYLSFINIALPTFLSLATATPNYPIDVQGQLHNVFQFADVPKEVEILFRGRRADNQVSSQRRDDMLFGLSDVRDDLSKYLRNWIILCNKMGSVLLLYFRVLWRNDLDLDTQFLFLAQVLEAYHRHRCDGEYIATTDYTPILNDLQQAIDDLRPKHSRLTDDLARKLKASLEYGNEYSFRKRLKAICREVLSDYPDILNAICGDIDVFIERIVSTRNFLTHRLQVSGPNVLTGQAMSDHTEKLLLVFRLCLLAEIEVPPDTVRDWLKDDPAVEYLKSRH